MHGVKGGIEEIDERVEAKEDEIEENLCLVLVDDAATNRIERASVLVGGREGGTIRGCGGALCGVENCAEEGVALVLGADELCREEGAVLWIGVVVGVFHVDGA